MLQPWFIMKNGFVSENKELCVMTGMVKNSWINGTMIDFFGWLGMVKGS
jgi:hypothetical protein